MSVRRKQMPESLGHPFHSTINPSIPSTHSFILYHPSIRLSIHQFIHPPIHSINPSTHSFILSILIHPSTHPLIYLQFIHPFQPSSLLLTHPLTSLLIHLYISISPLLYPPRCACMHPSIHSPTQKHHLQEQMDDSEFKTS